MSVRKLFFNTPARLKFLKSKTAETAQMIRVFQEQALAHPEIGFRLVLNKQEHLVCVPGDDLLSRIRVLLGNDLAAQMRPLEFKSAPLKIYGYVSRAGQGFATRKQQYVFVNKRCISDKTVTHAIVQAYHTHLGEKQFPAAVLFLEMPTELVDVNVHPAKREVRFRDTAVLHDMLVQAIRAALNEKQDLPDMLRGAAAAEKNRAAPAGYAAENSNLPAELFAETVIKEKETFFAAEPGFEKVKLLQVKRTYIVAEDEDGITLIDQHAAHERILFDRLLGQFRQKKIEKQKLLLPAVIHLDPEAFLAVRERADIFRALGFDLEEFGAQTFALYAYPAALGQADMTAEFARIAAEISELEAGADMEKSITQLLAPLACHAAIRAGESLSPQQMSALFRDLFAAESAHTCPHGRPTFVKISLAELEKKFKRR